MTFGSADADGDRGVMAVAGGTNPQEAAEILADAEASTPRDLDPREAGGSLPLIWAIVSIR